MTFKLKDETGTKKERVYMGELPMMTRREPSSSMAQSALSFPSCTALPVFASRSLFTLTERFFTLSVLFRTGDPGWRSNLIRTTFFTSTSTVVVVVVKFLATTFLRALGYPSERELIEQFYKVKKLKLSESMDEEELSPMVLFEDIKDGDLVVARAYDPLTIGVQLRQLLALKIKTIEVVDSRDDEILLKSLRKIRLKMRKVHSRIFTRSCGPVTRRLRRMLGLS